MKTTRIFFRALLTALVAGGLFIGLGQPVLAGDEGAAAPARVNSTLTLVQQTKTERDGTEYLVLVARLLKQDGYPLSERAVSFYEINDVFGTSSVPIGSAVTSSAGIATLRYETRLLGDHAVSASFSGDAEAAPVQVAASFKLAKLPAVRAEHEPAGLDGLGNLTLLAVGGIVAAIWALLLGVLVGVMHGIKSNARAA